MKHLVRHETCFHYSEPASLSQNELFLYPRETASQKVTESILTVTPEPQYLNRWTDYFGNIAQVFMVQHPHHTLTITAVSRVTSIPPIIPSSETTPSWESAVQHLARHGDPAAMDAFQFVFPSPMIPVMPDAADYARPSFPPGTTVLAGATDLMRRIFTEFAYDKSATTVDTPVSRVLADRRGVCQDFAHTAISCLRSLGLAARYVSGYLKTLPPPGKPKLVGADASHAWLAIFVPGTGWVDLDPTNNQIPGESYITLAWGRDYGDVTPVKGVVMGGGVHTLSVVVDVTEK